MVKATLYKPNDEMDLVSPENGTDFQLEELYELLECDMIQVISLGCTKRFGQTIMVIDESGKLKMHIANEEATKLAWKQHGIDTSDYIAGKALVCSLSMLR